MSKHSAAKRAAKKLNVTPAAIKTLAELGTLNRMLPRKVVSAIRDEFGLTGVATPTATLTDEIRENYDQFVPAAPEYVPVGSQVWATPEVSRLVTGWSDMSSAERRAVLTSAWDKQTPLGASDVTEILSKSRISQG